MMNNLIKMICWNQIILLLTKHNTMKIKLKNIRYQLLNTIQKKLTHFQTRILYMNNQNFQFMMQSY